MTVGIVGTGGVARYHAAAIAGLAPRCRLVGVTDHSREKATAFLAEHADPAVPVYDDDAALLRGARPKLVCVCTPPGSHAEIAERALCGGAWAYVEKPLCASLAQLARLETVERETGRRVAGVVQWRSGHAAQVAGRWAQAGTFGRPLAAVANTLWYRDAAYYDVPWRGRWDTEVGGTTVSHGIHTLDLLLWLTGDWREVRAMATRVSRNIEAEDVSAAVVGLAGGGVASVINSCLSPRQESYLRIDFEHATLELRHVTFYTSAHWTLTTAPGHEPLAEQWQEELATGDAPPTQRSQLARLLDAMDRDAPPPTHLGEMRRTLEFITALYKSAAIGRPVAAGSIVAGDAFYDHIAGGRDWL